MQKVFQKLSQVLIKTTSRKFYIKNLNLILNFIEMKNISKYFFLHFIKQFKDINQKGLKELVKKIMILLFMIIKFPIYLFAFAAYLLMHLIKPIIIIRVSCIPCINFLEIWWHLLHCMLSKK